MLDQLFYAYVELCRLQTPSIFQIQFLAINKYICFPLNIYGTGMVIDCAVKKTLF